MTEKSESGERVTSNRPMDASERLLLLSMHLAVGRQSCLQCKHLDN